MQNESQTERATRRRKTLLALLHRGPQRYDELITAIDREQLFQYDREEEPATIARQQKYQFRRDLRVLRLHYQIKHDKKTQYYSLLETPFGLSLEQKHLAAFALALHTFQKMTIPYANDVQDLFSFLLSRLPDDQQKAIVEQRSALQIEFHEKTDYSKTDPVTLNEIGKAILRGQQLEFTYRSPRQGEEVRHIIEPQPLKYKDGHVYLSGWSIKYQNELHFRLDYVLPGTAKMLNKRITQSRPSQRTYLLRYHLTPTIARNSVSKQFPEQKVVEHPDGSATITANIDNLFDVRQIMLKYGENCTIEAPPELIALMRPVATHFAQTYLTVEE
ncbi:MAG: WYL domain-containing protein [Ktedonobacteraceae bacterium]